MIIPVRVRQAQIHNADCRCRRCLPPLPGETALGRIIASCFAWLRP